MVGLLAFWKTTICGIYLRKYPPYFLLLSLKAERSRLRLQPINSWFRMVEDPMFDHQLKTRIHLGTHPKRIKPAVAQRARAYCGSCSRRSRAGNVTAAHAPFDSSAFPPPPFLTKEEVRAGGKAARAHEKQQAREGWGKGPRGKTAV